MGSMLFDSSYTGSGHIDIFLVDRLAYAGVGWAIWRSKEFLPQEILFTVNYLGSPQVSFTLNFSKSAVQVIGQCVLLLKFACFVTRSRNNFNYSRLPAPAPRQGRLPRDHD